MCQPVTGVKLTGEVTKVASLHLRLENDKIWKLLTVKCLC